MAVQPGFLTRLAHIPGRGAAAALEGSGRFIKGLLTLGRGKHIKEVNKHGVIDIGKNGIANEAGQFAKDNPTSEILFGIDPSYKGSWLGRQTMNLGLAASNIANHLGRKLRGGSKLNHYAGKGDRFRSMLKDALGFYALKSGADFTANAIEPESGLYREVPDPDNPGEFVRVPVSAESLNGHFMENPYATGADDKYSLVPVEGRLVKSKTPAILKPVASLLRGLGGTTQYMAGWTTPAVYVPELAGLAGDMTGVNRNDMAAAGVEAAKLSSDYANSRMHHLYANNRPEDIRAIMSDKDRFVNYLTEGAPSTYSNSSPILGPVARWWARRNVRKDIEESWDKMDKSNIDNMVRAKRFGLVDNIVHSNIDRQMGDLNRKIYNNLFDSPVMTFDNTMTDEDLVDSYAKGMYGAFNTYDRMNRWRH